VVAGSFLALLGGFLDLPHYLESFLHNSWGSLEPRSGCAIRCSLPFSFRSSPAISCSSSLLGSISKLSYSWASSTILPADACSISSWSLLWCMYPDSSRKLIQVQGVMASLLSLFQPYLLKTGFHRWALSPISVISDIGLSLISERPISDWRAESPTLYRILE
jgi:hypothetical protein